jgi:hypothetical protein
VLLDEDQVQPQDTLTYRLKFRFWFQARHMYNSNMEKLRGRDTCRRRLKTLSGKELRDPSAADCFKNDDI